MKEKYIWIMCAHSESGDRYNACGVWNYEPSQKEIDSIRVELDSEEIDDDNREFYGDADGSDSRIIMNGLEYETYIRDYEILKRTITEK
jgi:hypothetical protein